MVDRSHYDVPISHGPTNVPAEPSVKSLIGDQLAGLRERHKRLEGDRDDLRKRLQFADMEVATLEFAIQGLEGALANGQISGQGTMIR